MKKWVNGLAICVAIAACFGTGVTGHADEPTDAVSYTHLTLPTT